MAAPFLVSHPAAMQPACQSSAEQLLDCIALARFLTDTQLDRSLYPKRWEILYRQLRDGIIAYHAGSHGGAA